MPQGIREVCGGKSVCLYPVIKGTSATRQPKFMGLSPKPRSLPNQGDWLLGKRHLPGAGFLFLNLSQLPE